MPMTSTQWVSGTGTTTATVTLNDGPRFYEVVCIDRIIANMTLGAAGTITISLSGTTITSKPIAVTTAPTGDLSRTISLDFPEGFPIWNATNSTNVPETSVTVTITGTGTPTAANVLVIYHHEKPMMRRM